MNRITNNLSEVDSDQPTQLFSLPLMGQGENTIESLTSYITRVSKAHSVSVGVFVSNVLAPQLRKPYLSRLALKGGTRFYARSSSYNGMGETVRDLISLLTTLTGRPDLHTATMVPFATGISSRNLIRPTKAWCPLCFEEMALSNSLYEPLLWALDAVKHCPEHVISLRTACPTCHKTIMYLERRVEIGLCPHCGTFLGSTCRFEETIADVQLERVLVIQNLMQQMQMPQFIPPDLKSKLAELVNVRFEGNAAAVARHIGVPKTTLWCWQHKNTLPALEQAVKILSLPNNSPLAEDTSGSHLACNNSRPKSHAPLPTCLSLTDIEIKLSGILSQPTQPSLSKVAQDLGTNTKFLYNHFPAYSKAITNAYREGVRLSAETRRKALIEKVQKTTKSLLDEGMYPSQRNVEKAMNRPAILREAALKEAWQQIVEQCAWN